MTTSTNNIEPSHSEDLGAMTNGLWEILVPTIHSSNGKPIRTRFHKVWDKKVREISGGLTIMHLLGGNG